MKVTLDIDELLSEQKITRAEYEKILALSATNTGSLGVGVLAAFGIVAVAGGLGALIPHYSTAVIVGIILTWASFMFNDGRSKTKLTLSSILLTIGVLTFSGGVLLGTEGAPVSMALLGFVFAVMARFASSGLLACLSPMFLAAAVGAGSMYTHATYFISVSAPTLTVLLFSALAYGAWKVHRVVEGADSRLVILFARTCLIIVNLGFWVGSLWGGEELSNSPGFGSVTFSVLWLVALLSTGLWAVYSNLRWTVNLCAVFGAIHFYTQFFSTLSANPGSLLIAGIVAIVIAMGISRLNKNMTEEYRCETAASGGASVKAGFTLPLASSRIKRDQLLG